jgi:3'-5' exoribonuclease
MKDCYIEDIKEKKQVEGLFMIMKKLYEDEEELTAYIGDNTGDIKAVIQKTDIDLKVGAVIGIKATKENLLKVYEYKLIEDYDLNDYLPSIKRPIEDIMEELDNISKEEFKGEEAKTLNDYFFKDKFFLEKFKKGIGGLSQHHNYRGGLAEHTLNVTYLTKVFAYRYNCRNKEIAILGAMLHDMGKIVEYDVDGPFSVSLEGDMEGHIVIGISMLEEAFKKGGSIYTEDFKNRIKGCIVQHHGKVEYGSPKAPNSEEAYIIHFADYVDATMNKITQIKEITEPNTWSEYDRRIGTRLYI